jgi:hypothetical protein
MVMLLTVVVILGVLATVVIAGSPGPKPTATTLEGSPPTTATTPQSIASAVPASQVSACAGDFASVDAALGGYRALNGAAPAPGTAWATSKAHGGPFLQGWPSGAPNFSISWNGTVLSVVPKKGTESHGSTGTVSPKTGCYAP